MPLAAISAAPLTGPRPQHPLIAAIDDLLGLHRKVAQIMDDAEGGTGDPLSADDKDIIKHYEEGLQKILDLIAPAAVEVRSNEMILNDQHSRTLYVYNWPNYIYPNWLSPLVNFDAQMEIAHFIYPSSNKAIMKMLRKKVVELRSSIRLLEQRGIVRDPTLEAALQDAEELRDLLARGREKLFQFGMYITLYAEDEEKLKKLQTDIESLLGGRLVLTKPALFQMEHAWNSTLPLCLDELEISRNMNTSPIGTSFPFSSCDLTDDHGILYGINRHNDSLVIFDRFDLPNANANVFATSGAGKSFTVKLEILRSLMLGTEVLVIDPENEYVELCKTVGGSFIPMSLQSDFRINPFDLPEAVRGEEAEVGEVLRTSVLNLHGLFKLMLGALTPAEDGILDKAILDTYALRGITITTEKPGTIDPPTMHDLVDVLLTTDGGENMARVLQKYTEGSYAGLFNRATNVELQKQMIVFQIRDLEDQLRPIAIYIILNFLWNRVRTELKKRFLVIDEAWNLMQYDDSARFLFGIVKRARKYYLGITTITQDVDDFVNSPYGKPIITNSALQILLKQSPTAVDNLQKLFYLTDGEKYVLLNSGVGQGIFFAGNKHVAIQIIASPVETTIVTTKPEEVLARMQSTGGKLAAEQTTDIPLSQFDGTVPKTSMQMLKQSEEILVAKTERDMAKSEKNDGGQDAQSSAPIPANAEESGNSAPAEGVSIPSRSIDQENPPPALSDDSSSITTSSEVPETTDENVIASTSLDDLLKQTTPKPPEIAADGIADNGSTAEAITDILPSPEDTPDVPPDLPDVTPQPATPRGGRILPPERKK